MRAVTVSASTIPARDLSNRMVAGVCSGLAARLGVDPIVLRVGFGAASLAGGFGVPLYLVGWLVMPAAPGATAAPPLGGPRALQVAAGIGCLTLAGLLALRALGWWFSDALTWPVVLAATGGALIWRQSQRAALEPEPPARAADRGRPRLAQVRVRLGRQAAGRVAIGGLLVIAAGLLFLWLTGTLAAARDTVLAGLVLLVVVALLFYPWWSRLARSLAAERAERIRSQERAELAAHLHDSVLQTLALVQQRAGDPRAVASLARRQERELRAWLNHGAGSEADAATLAGALREAAAEVDDTYGVAIEVVCVGDAPLDERTRALAGAAREALTNAAKFAPDAAISLYAEVAGGRAEVFVRDRGAGFDPDAVPPDRRGLAESVFGRMERHGGRALVHAAPGSGTEVELVMEGVTM
jgi:signal transduction histidine kinase/phage shock protein PspC (stress-responsive transcriptional regulator)